MGASNKVYINTKEVTLTFYLQDFVEKFTKKGYGLRQLLMQSGIPDINQLLNMKFNPVRKYQLKQNGWNIFHLAVWYANKTLLNDLINDNSFDKKYVDFPDVVILK